MTEKFYCVGCKEHYQLPVTEAVKKPSKGDSFRHSVVSYCPKGHKTTKICNKDDYDKYSSSKAAETVVGTMSPGAGINAALEPLQGGLENGDEPSLVPADSFQPNGNGHVIGQETDSYNTTPMHAEDDFEPYFELCIVSNGTIGDIVGDYDEPESEKAFKEWEDAVNDGGPHVLIYYDSADADGMIVAGDDFMDVYWDAESESTGNRKAIMATAAAALVLALVWYRSSRN
jgi:hypothetical protein